MGTFLNTIKRILDVLHCKVEDKLKTWASYLPVGGDKKSNFGEQMNEITVLLRTKYKNYTQAIVVKLVANVSSKISFPSLHETCQVCSIMSRRPHGINRIGEFAIKGWK